MLFNRANNVALHDLHVVNVVQELHTARVDQFANAQTKCSGIRLIIWVIHLGVQHLENQVHTRIFGVFCNSSQTLGCDMCTSFKIQTAFAARKTDQIWNVPTLGNSQFLEQFGFDSGVVFPLVQTVNDAVMTVNGTDLQTRISSNTVQGFGQQINAFKANLGGFKKQFSRLEQFFKTPKGKALLHIFETRVAASKSSAVNPPALCVIYATRTDFQQISRLSGW